MSQDILVEICNAKRLHVTERKTVTPLTELQKICVTLPPTRCFQNALFAKTTAGYIGLIAEIKKASPSAGLIRADFDVAQLARAYAAGGAACLSVLTDAPYFQGHDDYVQQAKDACALPVLRKDFMIDTYQVYEARAIGADCILIIMAAVDDALAAELYQTATALGMDSLFEVHDADEMERAFALQPKLLGINNRNLKTLAIDLNTSIELARLVPSNTILVSESGIYSHTDIQRIQQSNIDCFLIGESLMKQTDVTAATHKLLNV